MNELLHLTSTYLKCHFIFFQVMQHTLLFYRIEPLKNGPSLILPFSIARNSSATNAKRIFQILWGILEGRTNSAWPSRPCLKNCQNGTFWTLHGIWKNFGPNGFIWDAMKVPFSDFSQKMSQDPSSSVQLLIWEDKLDYLKNPSQDFKNSFCLGFLWIPKKTGRQNWRGPIFLRFDLIE